MAADDGSARAGRSGGGMLGALRGIGPALVGLIRTRVELFGLELAEERARAGRLAVLGGAALLFAGMLLLLVNVLVLALFWDGHRYQAIVGLIVVHGVGFAWAAAAIKTSIDSRPPMFEATIAELKADLEALNRARQD
jgi:uncharacterized membrane protein YqjE